MDQGWTHESGAGAGAPANDRIDDVIGGNRRLDFSRPFLPEAIAGVEALSFLSPEERRTVNQIRGNGYLSLIGLVEEHILPFVLDRTWPLVEEERRELRSVEPFTPEDADHIHLFRRFRAALTEGFPGRCEVTRPPALIARDILGRSPLAIVLTILHIEWMTQRHYLDAVRDPVPLDGCFARLFQHRWLSVVQHARLDILLAEARAVTPSGGGVARSVEEYLEIAGIIDVGLARQVDLDLEALERATGRALRGEERAAFRRIQHRSQRWTFLGAGMTHPRFTAALADLGDDHRRHVARAAVTYS